MHPGFAVGPTLVNEKRSSIGLIGNIISGEMKGIGDMPFWLVDVRDVALAHYRALQGEGLNGERIILVDSLMRLPEMARILA